VRQLLPERPVLREPHRKNRPGKRKLRRNLMSRRLLDPKSHRRKLVESALPPKSQRKKLLVDDLVLVLTPRSLPNELGPRMLGERSDLAARILTKTNRLAKLAVGLSTGTMESSVLRNKAPGLAPRSLDPKQSQRSSRISFIRKRIIPSLLPLSIPPNLLADSQSMTLPVVVMSSRRLSMCPISSNACTMPR